MKLILRSDLDGLGKRGDIVDVADGYGRNYLLPQGLALIATAGAVDQAARMRQARDLRDANDREAATPIATTPGAEDHHDHGQGRSGRPVVRFGHAADIVAAVERPDRHRARPAAPRQRADQGARPAHGHGDAALRRVVPDHRRRRLRV